MKDIRAIEVKSLLIVYGVLFAVSFLADFITHYDPFFSWKPSQPLSSFVVFLTLIFIFAYVIGALLAARIFHWANEMKKIFAQVLTPLSYLQIVVLALLSGFIEEWFFRGVLMTHFGLILSSIFFGLAHFIPSRSVWMYGLISLLSGLVFGLLFKQSGNLILVALAHSTINFLLFLKLNQASVGAPSLT